MSAPWEQFPPLQLDSTDPVLRVLDQTVLPFAVRYVEIDSVGGCAAAIRDMQVRGAPLIGLAAAAGVFVAMSRDPSDQALQTACAELLASRPTAVNLRWAVENMRALLLPQRAAARAAAARLRFAELQRAEHSCCARIAEHGFELLRELSHTARVRARGTLNVLTHCNAGWLATGAWGTALAPLYKAALAGLAIHVWVDETRPRNQGARLSAWELGQAGIAHTVVVDNCAGHLMQRGLVDVCVVGSDRTTRSGDVCNKIGTYQKALAAADNNVPFYVALPVSTIDWSIEDGVGEIEIETRDPAEVVQFDGVDAAGDPVSVRNVAPGSAALNYAFDVTPARLVRGLICEYGVFDANATDLRRLRGMAGVAPEPV